MGQHKYGTLEDRQEKIARARLIMRKMAKEITSLESEMHHEVGIRDGVSDLVAMSATLRSAAMTMEREREAIMEMAITNEGGEI